jgi:hypothetical protein
MRQRERAEIRYGRRFKLHPDPRVRAPGSGLIDGVFFSTFHVRDEGARPSGISARHRRHAINPSK